MVKSQQQYFTLFYRAKPKTSFHPLPYMTLYICPFSLVYPIFSYLSSKTEDLSIDNSSPNLFTKMSGIQLKLKAESYGQELT